jgi:hypothetical protein
MILSNKLVVNNVLINFESILYTVDENEGEKIETTDYETRDIEKTSI